MSSDGKGSADNGSEPRRGEISPAEREALKQRADAIGKRLGEVNARRTTMSEEDRRARGSALGQAFKISVELVAGVAVGGFIGWTLDRLFNTRPWLLVLFLVFGFAAGLLNTIRTARRMQAGAEPLQRRAPSVKDDEDES